MIQTDQKDNFLAMQKRRQMEKHANRNNAGNSVNGRDPMELEFSQASVIMRLNRMKNVLKTGKLVNQIKLEERMGNSMNNQKLYHK